MSGLRELNGTCWKGFRMDNSYVQRWFYTDENKALRLIDKPYFNKNTNIIVIYKGFETVEHSEVPISEEITYIGVSYHIASYFGDKSGRHYRNKAYLLMDGKVLQRSDYGEFKEIIRLNKELKGVLSELKFNFIK